MHQVRALSLMAPGADAATRARRSVRLSRELQAAEAALADACDEVAKAERFFPVPGAADAGPSPQLRPYPSPDPDEPRQLDGALRAVVAAQAALGGVWVHLAQQPVPGDPPPTPSQGPHAAHGASLAAGGAAWCPSIRQGVLAAEAEGLQGALAVEHIVDGEGAGGPAPAAGGEEGAPALELDAPDEARAPASGHAGGSSDPAGPAAGTDTARAPDALPSTDTPAEPAGPAPASAAAARAATGSGADGAAEPALLTPAMAAAAGGAVHNPGAGFGGRLYVVAPVGKPAATPPCHPLAAITPSTCASAPTPASAPSQAVSRGQAARVRVPHIDAETFDACFSMEPPPQGEPACRPVEGFLQGMPATKLFHAPLADSHLEPDPVPGGEGDEQPSGRAGPANNLKPAPSQRAFAEAKADSRKRAGRAGRREVRVRASYSGEGLQRVVYASGDEYAGEVAGGLAAGLGVYSFAGEGRYEGEVSSASSLVFETLPRALLQARWRAA